MSRLSNYLTFTNGKKRPGSGGTIPVYGGNGAFELTDKGNNENCIIIGRVGAYCGSVYYEPGPCWVSDNAIAATPKEDNCIAYFYYLLLGLNLQHRQIGTSQPLITQSVLNAIDVAPHGIQDQWRIAVILNSIDSRIDQHNRTNRHLAA